MPTKDPEKRREQQRLWRERNRDAINAKVRAKTATPEGRAKRNEYDQRFRETHPGYAAEYHRQRRANAEPQPRAPRPKQGPMGGEDDVRHGTLNGYNNLRCRCPRCKAANAAQQRDYRERTRGPAKSRKPEPMGGPDDPRHGTRYGHHLGCRCVRCRGAAAQYQRERRRKNREGQA